VTPSDIAENISTLMNCAFMRGERGLAKTLPAHFL
jgi:hypothetical protein